VIYLKWKLSHGKWGTHPVETIAAMGGRATTGAYVDADGYRIAYLWESIDISQLDSKWDVTEVTEAEALAFAQALWADAEIGDDGTLLYNPPEPGPPPDDAL